LDSNLLVVEEVEESRDRFTVDFGLMAERACFVGDSPDSAVGVIAASRRLYCMCPMIGLQKSRM